MAVVFILMVAALIPGTTLVAEDGSSNDYLASAWNIENGLPQNSVLCLLQSSDGYIWFGTQSGLTRFDGVSFRVFNRWNSSALKNDRVLSLFQHSDGALWTGTDGGGISRFKDGKWTLFTQQQGLADNTVRAISEDKQKNLWAATNNGLNRIKDGIIERYTMDDGLLGLPVLSLAPGRDGSLWIGTGSGGVYALKDGKFKHIPLPGHDGTRTSGSAEISALHQDDSGDLWVGTEYGLFQLVNGNPRNPACKIFLKQKSIKTILEDQSGNIWAGTEGEGLYRRRGETFQRIMTRQGLPDFFIYSIMQDREKNIWLGTYAAGLLRLKLAKVKNITRQNGLTGNKVNTIVQDDRNNLWIGTGRSGVCLVRNRRVIRRITKENGLSGNRVRALWYDAGQALWIGTTSGLNRLDLSQPGPRIQVFRIAEGLSSNWVTAIFRDSSGTLWVGTADGLNRRLEQEGTFEVYKQRSGLVNTYIRTIVKDPGGGLLLGTRGGLFHLDSSAGIIKDLCGKENPFNYDILSIFPDKNRYIWAGTNGSGLVRLKKRSNGSVQRTFFTAGQGLPDNYIFSITHDPSGYLWISSYKGVFRLSMAQLSNSFVSSNAGNRTITALLLDEKEGMAGSECTLAGEPAAWQTAAGELLVATANGIAVLAPKAITTGTIPPPVIIQSVIADNQPIQLKQPGGLSLPPETRVMEFYFTALSFSAPGKVRLRYMLDGFDRQWKEITSKNRTALYLNLPAGHYRFRVMACSSSGVWNPEAANFSFSVSAPFYKKPLNLIILLLVILSITGVVLWFRFRSHPPAPVETVVLSESETVDAPPVHEQAAPVPVHEKYKTSALLPETVDAVMPQLNRLMKEDKLYLDPQLNLKELAKKVNVHYNHLSRIINEQKGKSFNDYINSYRIREAQKRLTDPSHAGKTVLEIAYDTGFYSKSVFNTAFKKFTGMTPTQYRKNSRSNKEEKKEKKA